MILLLWRVEQRILKFVRQNIILGEIIMNFKEIQEYVGTITLTKKVYLEIEHMMKYAKAFKISELNDYVYFEGIKSTIISVNDYPFLKNIIDKKKQNSNKVNTICKYI